MVHKIRVSRDRVSTAQYVLKKTKGGYRGYVKKNKKPVDSSPSTTHAAKPTPGKRPRLESYIPPPDDTLDHNPISSQISPALNAFELPPQDDEVYREELMVPHSGKSSKGKVSCYSADINHRRRPSSSYRLPMSTWKSGRAPDSWLISTGLSQPKHDSGLGATTVINRRAYGDVSTVTLTPTRAPSAVVRHIARIPSTALSGGMASIGVQPGSGMSAHPSVWATVEIYARLTSRLSRRLNLALSGSMKSTISKATTRLVRYPRRLLVLASAAWSPLFTSMVSTTFLSFLVGVIRQYPMTFSSWMRVFTLPLPITYLRRSPSTCSINSTCSKSTPTCQLSTSVPSYAVSRTSSFPTRHW